MRGIVSLAAYVPHQRLRRAAVGQALGQRGGPGTRTVAGYDEDTTTLGVEAARLALASVRTDAGTATGTGTGTGTVRRLLFATTAPAYLDKTNATALHAALGLPPATLALDTGGALRSGVGSLLTAVQGGPTTLVVTADMRNGRPGSDEETGGGDAAAAVVVGETGVIAEFLGGASLTFEVMDRWRLAGDTTARTWEERFGEAAYGAFVGDAIDTALKDAGVSRDGMTVLVTGSHARAVRSAGKAITAPDTTVADDLSEMLGRCGAAHGALLLASALESATPGQVVTLASLADGVDVLVFRATPAIAGFRPAVPLRDQIAAGRDDLSYARFLTWRGFLDREPPRRPDPPRTAPPPAFRGREWKFGLTPETGPKHPVVRGTIATYTVDHLAFSPSPPTIVAVVDLDGGGRQVTELTDVEPEAVGVGDRVEMTFRRFYTAAGIHNYFWKARPERVVTER